MYEVVRSASFRKSLKRLARTPEFDIKKLEGVINAISASEKLPEKFRDHELKGKMSGMRECHLDSDLLLKYEVDQKLKLVTLLDIGSHSYLFE